MAPTAATPPTADLVSQLQQQNTFLVPADVESLDQELHAQLAAWARITPAMRTASQPALLMAKSHIAGVAGADGAHCTRCGGRLGRLDDKTDYPAGALVGLDCPGDVTVQTPAKRRRTETVTAINAAAFLMLPIAKLTESPLNPRQHFDAKKLQDLAASIKGVGVIEPLVARAVKGDGQFEIIAGARRLRGAKLAKLTEVPVIVRELSDAAALEIMVIENNQREDVNPLEEAAGYAALMKADERYRDRAVIAAKIGRSESYIHQRMKLLELIPGAQKALLADELTAGHAILLARLQPKNQEEGLKFCFNDGYGYQQRGDEKRAISVRQLTRWINEHVHLDLHAAPFRKDDATLVTTAGACTICPKRTGSNPPLFEDIKKGDTCTDPTCYQAKLAAFTARSVEQAKEKAGADVIRISDRDYVHGHDEKRLKADGTLVKAGYSPKAGSWKAAGNKKCPYTKAAIVVDAENPGGLGRRADVCTAPDKCAVHTDKIARSNSSYNRRADGERKAKQQKLAREGKVLGAILAAIRDKVTELKREDLRFVAVRMAHECQLDRQTEAYRLMGWPPIEKRNGYGDSQKAIARELAKATPAILARFLLVAALSSAAHVHEYLSSDPKPLYDAAKRWKVNHEAIRSGFAAADRAKAAKARGKAKKGKAVAARSKKAKKAKAA